MAADDRRRPIELLVYEPSFHRVRDRLQDLSGAVAPVLVDREGRLSRPDGERKTVSYGVEISWSSPEVFIDRALPAFMGHVLSAPKVRWLQSGSAGFDNPLLQFAMRRGIKITVNPAPANSIAEYVFATDPYADALHTIDAIDEHLPRADVVVLPVPLEPATQGLADAAFFSRMKAGSIIVNVARGGLLNEAALLEGLGRHRPAHAILDVFDIGPLPSPSPLWRHPQVTLTAHLAGMGSGLPQRSDAFFLKNLERYLKGEPLLGLADDRRK